MVLSHEVDSLLCFGWMDHIVVQLCCILYAYICDVITKLGLQTDLVDAIALKNLLDAMHQICSSVNHSY